MSRELCLLVLVFGMVGSCLAGNYGGGSGTAEDPYQIWTAEHMQSIVDSEDTHKHFVLMDDISIGSFNGINSFSGIFDGNGHTISSFRRVGFGSGGFVGRIGLFGSLSKNSIVKDLSITNAYIRTLPLGGDEPIGRKVGILAGSSSGTISGCFVEGYVTGEIDVGGMVGYNEGVIENCIANCLVGLPGSEEEGFETIVWHRADTDIGGLCGKSHSGTVINCSSVGEVEGNYAVGGLVGIGERFSKISYSHSGSLVKGYETGTGGLVGYIYEGVIVTNCYSTGNINGYKSVGGLIGWCNVSLTASTCEVYDSYATGDVSGSRFVGGLMGEVGSWDIIESCFSSGFVTGHDIVGGFIGKNESEIDYCYWDMETSGQVVGFGSSDFDYDVKGKTTAEMHQQSTFTDWDFINVWDIGENQTYPYLRTHSTADLNKDRIVNLFDLSILAEQWLQHKSN